MLKIALQNRAINLLNIHFGFLLFAESLVSIFLGIYLYEVGVPLWGVFLCLGVLNFLRLLLRPLVITMVYWIGLRRTLIVGTLSFLPMYPVLGQVDGVGIWLWLFILVATVPYTFYWTAYHPYFSMLGDVEHRGKQLGIRGIALQAAAVMAPLLGGILISTFSFNASLIVAIILTLVSVVPLLRTPEVPLPPQMNHSQALKKVGKEGFWMFFANDIQLIHQDTVWKLVLFFLLQNYITFGGLLSLAVLFQIIGAFFVGHSFDKGGGKKMFLLGIAIIILTIIGRVFFAYSVPMIIFLDLLFMVGGCLYGPINDAVVYNFSKKSHCPLWFHYFAEIGADIGATVSCLFVAGFVYWGGELRLTMLAGIGGIVLSGVILRSYFQRNLEK